MEEKRFANGNLKGQCCDVRFYSQPLRSKVNKWQEIQRINCQQQEQICP